MDRIDVLAKIIWDYHHLNHDMEESDCIVVLGSHDPSVANRAVELYKDGYADKIVFSGGVLHPAGTFGNEVPMTEAEALSEIAINIGGVPQDNVILENNATNTGENFSCTIKLLNELNLPRDKFILVQKPYMERRTLATGLVQWPDKKMLVTSPQVSYEDYLKMIPRERFINTMVGDLQRIKIYPDLGFQAYMEIPKSVWDAFEELVDLGFDKRLVK